MSNVAFDCVGWFNITQQDVRSLDGKKITCRCLLISRVYFKSVAVVMFVSVLF